MRTEQQKAYRREYRKRPEVRARRNAYERERRKRPEVRARIRESSRAYNREYMRRIFALARAARAAGLEASP